MREASSLELPQEGARGGVEGSIEEDLSLRPPEASRIYGSSLDPRQGASLPQGANEPAQERVNVILSTRRRAKAEEEGLLGGFPGGGALSGGLFGEALDPEDQMAPSLSPPAWRAKDLQVV